MGVYTAFVGRRSVNSGGHLAPLHCKHQLHTFPRLVSTHRIKVLALNSPTTKFCDTYILCGSCAYPIIESKHSGQLCESSRLSFHALFETYCSNSMSSQARSKDGTALPACWSKLRHCNPCGHGARSTFKRKAEACAPGAQNLQRRKHVERPFESSGALFSVEAQPGLSLGPCDSCSQKSMTSEAERTR